MAAFAGAAERSASRASAVCLACRLPMCRRDVPRERLARSASGSLSKMVRRMGSWGGVLCGAMWDV
jgi:hypothetical protein